MVAREWRELLYLLARSGDISTWGLQRTGASR